MLTAGFIYLLIYFFANINPNKRFCSVRAECCVVYTVFQKFRNNHFSGIATPDAL